MKVDSMAAITIAPGSPFTIDNIPFGVITTRDDPTPRCATAIGDFAVDLESYARSGRLKDLQADRSFVEIFSQSSLNTFASLPRSLRTAVRERIQDDIRNQLLASECLIPLSQTTNLMPMTVQGYSDFYCSLEHCRNCSPMSANNVPKNWFYAPSVYNGRSSSLVVSPQPIRRPHGVFYKPGTDKVPTYGPSQLLDYELEMGYFVSQPVPHGQTLKIEDVKEHIFGFVLLNDWSARDLQLFEMTPLGPFHGKGFGTSISPWIITMDALEPFSCSPKTAQDPPPFEHLEWNDWSTGTFDIKLQVTLIRGGKEYKMARSNLRYLYWTPYQQLTHHASAMCGMNTGDLCGTGTISGDEVDENGNKMELGCLYEATEAGSTSIKLSEGKEMQYLLDGDAVVLDAWCGDIDGKAVSLGFGGCRGVILPAAWDVM